MKDKSKEKKQIDLAIEEHFKTGRFNGFTYECYAKGFRDGTEYQKSLSSNAEKNTVTPNIDPLKDMKKKETFQELSKKLDKVFSNYSNGKNMNYSKLLEIGTEILKDMQPVTTDSEIKSKDKKIESDGQEFTKEEINDGFVQNVSCKKCNDRGNIYNDNGCFSNLCKCHY